MKPTTKSTLRRALPWSALAAATLALADTSAFAQTLLLSDNFNTAGDAYGGFNDAGNLTADQSGAAATKDYNIVINPTGWPGAFQRGNGGQWLMHANGTFATEMHGSLNYDIAAAANTLSSPLEIKFTMSVNNGAGGDTTLWTSFTVGSAQNPFVFSNTVGFSSLFRDNGGTQQFSNTTLTPGGDASQIGSTATFTDGQLITFVLSDAAGTGSAFNSDGANDVVKMYVNGSLVDTFTGLDLGPDDQYISFHAAGTETFIDNLAITALTTATDYDTWAGPSGFNLSGGPAADDDNDGLSNHEEYAFGLIPNSGASVNPIAVQLNKTTGTFTYTRRDPVTKNTGLTYTIWTSTNLVDWNLETNLSAGQTPGTPDGNGIQSVVVTLTPVPTAPKLFVQVRAN